MKLCLVPWLLPADGKTIYCTYPLGHGGPAAVLKKSADGGLTWADQRQAAEYPGGCPCEPLVIRSPDGKQLAALARENARRYNSLLITSSDEGTTWSAPVELPASLTGDRHMGRYAADGRLVLCFRDMAAGSPTKGDFVAWVGTYDDVVKLREGQYRVRLLRSPQKGDLGYPGVEVLPDGTFVATTYAVLAFCEGRKHSGGDSGDIDLLLKRSTDGGRSWSKPVEITAAVKKPDWTWYATGPGAGIQTRGGRLVIPCDHVEAPGKAMASHVITSDDQGATWKLGGSAPLKTNECEVVELADGRLLLNMRNYDRQHKCRAVATSRDGGDTWSAVAYDETLVEPVCQASIRRYSWPVDGVGSRILFSNPGEPDKRKEMTLRLSEDEAKTWPVGKVLYAGPAAYSCLAVLPDGTILCLYERGLKQAYEKITLARCTLAWLTDGAGK